MQTNLFAHPKKRSSTFPSRRHAVFLIFNLSHGNSHRLVVVCLAAVVTEKLRQARQHLAVAVLARRPLRRRRGRQLRRRRGAAIGVEHQHDVPHRGPVRPIVLNAEQSYVRAPPDVLRPRSQLAAQRRVDQLRQRLLLLSANPGRPPP